MGCRSLTSITIPNSVTSIGDRAFFGCTSLASVKIGNSAKDIGEGAFYKCTSLRSITFNGAKWQWQAIDKASYWNYDVPATVVHCTDGDVSI